MIRIGCSGWNYRHLRGLFYPDGLPQTRWFDHYAATFDTVEINNSFYRLQGRDLRQMARRGTPGFCYAVKANRFLTPARKLKDCAAPLQRMLTPFRHLGDRLGPILYQLPPRFRLNLDRLEDFIALLPRDLVNVFEFREKSWYADEVLALLDARDMSFCAHDMPGLTSPRRAAGPIAYVRFHGSAGKYVGRYPDQALLCWTDRMVEQARGGRDVWAYFNNDIHGDAIEDAQTLKAMVRQAMR